MNVAANASITKSGLENGVAKPEPGFRNALKQFATGITVITANAGEDTPIGLTVNSFNSVSLSPPLVLWSLRNESGLSDVFKRATHFAVCILGANQMDIAARFASRIEDRFAGISWRQGEYRVPILAGCIAWFECKAQQQHLAGDHTIYIGEVISFGHEERAPLLYAGGKYCVPAPHMSQSPQT